MTDVEHHLSRHMTRAEMLARLEACHRESFGWALNCCRRERSEAENVLQTVYLKILEEKARFDGRSEFKTWLFSVIRKTAADARRRETCRRFLSLKFLQARETSTDSDATDRRLYRSEMQERFRHELACLAHRQRQVLLLVFYHDMTISEAARAMGISVGSARAHYDRGKRRLRHLMMQKGIFNELEFGRKRDQEVVS